ncbi:unnamed protein product [Paramecium primaurelia]|uniref:Transmembrane protein n=1 Tax=Paramecium primaurelia TaxID=5886 RepID=A0A8S1M9J4_PARPR|nr:unnamed protein product [Paramecium primaurelia]
MMMILLFILYLNAQSIDFCSLGCQFFNDSTKCESLKPLCSWNFNNRTCIKGYMEPQIDIYQSQITQFCSYNKDKCSKTYGCSFYNNMCIKFLGCDAYQSYSDQDCLNISYLCSWDEEKQRCVRSPYYDYRGNIKQQRDCNLADLGWRSQDGCPKYSSQCIFNQIECVESLGSCNQYQTTPENCRKLIGVDGQCDYYENNCRAQRCEGYDKTQCNQYRLDCYFDNICQQKQKCERSNVKIKSQCQNTIEQNCYFDGRTCSLIPLQLCSVYQKSQCQGTVGIDGICILQNDKCIKLNCENDLKQQYKNMELFQDYCQELKYCEQKNINCIQIAQDECLNINKTIQNCNCQKCIINKQECIYASTQLECEQNQQLYSTIPCYWNQDQNYCQSATKCSQLQNKSSCQKLKPSCVFRNNTCVDILELNCNQIYSIENGDQIMQNYCILSRGCAIFNSKCITLNLNCDNYKSETTCFKDITNQPCVWNSEIRKCINYKEREQIININECELISSFWTYKNGICDIRKSCSQLNQTEIGLEGNCTLYYLKQIESKATTCSDIDISICSNFSHICKKYNNTCQNLSCSDLNSTQCKPIIGLQLKDYKYCRLFGDDCIETLPTNERDCYLFGAGSKFFNENYCVSCIRHGECKSLPYVNKEPSTESFQLKLSIIMIIFYIFIIQ